MAHRYLYISHCFQYPVLPFILLGCLFKFQLTVYENHIIWTGKDTSVLQNFDDSAWDNLPFFYFVHHLIKKMTFWKLALLLSSGKETPNLVDPLHRAILSHSLTENTFTRKRTKFTKRKSCQRGKGNNMK